MRLLKTVIAPALCLCWTLSAPGVLVNGTAAKVGDRLITIEDAYFFHSLNAFKESAPIPKKQPEREELKKTVQKMIFEEMVFSQAQNFKFQDVPTHEAKKIVATGARGERQGEWQGILKRFRKGESAAIERLTKSLVVERFVQRKVETLTPIITDAEAEQYYRQNPGRFRGQALEKIRPTIILLLKKQRVEAGLEEWIRFLKKKYQVANFLEG